VVNENQRSKEKIQMMKFVRGLILLLVMVLASQPVYATRLGDVGVFFAGAFFIGLPCLIILLIFIIISAVFLIQRRSTSGRRTYGKVAEVISYLLILPLPIFVFWFSASHGSNSFGESLVVALVVCAAAAIPGGLSAFLAHKVKKLPAENSSP
jgi:hypothetical protein